MAIDFDGVDDIVNCGSPAHLDDLANWTHCAWIYARSVGEANFGIVFRKNANDAALGKVLHVEATGSFRGAARRATTNLSLEASDNTIALGAWVFIAFTYDGTTGRLLKGSPGGAVAEVTYKVNTQGAGALTSDSAGELIIGNDVTGATTFDGRIAYGRWFKKALTADELTSIMYNRLVRMEDGVGDWWLDDLSATDRSGYAANGTLTGSPILGDGPPVPPPFYVDEDYPLSAAVAAAATFERRLRHTIYPVPGPYNPGQFMRRRGSKFQPGQTILIADTGAGADALAIAVGIAIADSGVGNDAVPASAAAVPVGDVGAGSDAITLQVSVSVADAASGVDVVSVLTALLLTVTDAAAGSDAISIAAQTAVTDAGAGADQPSLAISLVVADSAAAVDAVSVLMATLKTVVDSGTGIDAVSVSVSVPVGDAGSGLDAVAIAALLSVIDAGAAVDIVVSFNAAVRIATITFSLAERSVSFSFKRRSISFEMR